MATGLITHPACMDHITPSEIPEQPARLTRVLQALNGLPLKRFEAPLASEDLLLSLHPLSYLDLLKSSIPADGFAVMDAETDQETILSPRSWPAILRAAGAVSYGVDLVMRGQVQNAFAAIRPPGHHAEANLPMGFCFLGNVALAARYAIDRYGLTRVAVVDFDVHHGNGTQALLWDEPKVLTVTSQQRPLWPGTGARDERGTAGNVLNVPLLPGSGGAELRRVFEAQVFPALNAFSPELLLISAGFDCHRADPLANLNWVEDDYRWLTGRLCDIAGAHCQGRVVSTLEGGYDLDALAASAAAHVDVLTEHAR